MNVKQLRFWLSLYPDDFEILIVTENGTRRISPIGQRTAKECAMVILPAEIIEKAHKGEL